MQDKGGDNQLSIGQQEPKQQTKAGPRRPKKEKICVEVEVSKIATERKMKLGKMKQEDTPWKEMETGFTLN